MLVDQQCGDCGDADERQRAEVHLPDQHQQRDDHTDVQELRDRQRFRDAKDLRDTEQLRFAVEIEILAGVDDVESGGPCGHGGGKPENSRIERTAYRNPGCRGRYAQREAQHHVRKMREAFGERIG